MWPPLGLWYLSSQLKAQGHKTDFFDLNFDELPKDGEYDQLWFSSTSPQIAEARRVGEETRDWKKTKRVIGGAGSWANPSSHVELPFDLVVAGEADHPDSIRKILELAEEPREKLLTLSVSRTLDWVLPPDRRWGLKYKSYMTDSEGNEYRMASLFTSRGCPMSCSFCESGRHGIIWDRLTRYESLDIVEAQIKEIKSQGFTGLAYYDDVFILNRKRTLAMLELHRKYDMRFRCFLRSDILSKHGGYDYLKAMKEGGLIEVFVGIESADNQIKENIHKGTTIEQDTDALRWCKELGVTFKGSFIFGLPGESLESMERTRQWILAQDPKGMRIQLDRLIPFKGTPLTDHPEDYDLQYENQPDENWFYRGRMDMESHSFVSTSNASVEQIDNSYRSLEKELIEKGYST